MIADARRTLVTHTHTRTHHHHLSPPTHPHEPHSAATIDRDVASVKSAAVKASLASLLSGLSPEEKKNVLSGL